MFMKDIFLWTFLGSSLEKAEETLSSSVKEDASPTIGRVLFKFQ